MPKRIRDYRAEERRRNELARQRGYTSRAAERTVRRKAKVAGIPLGRQPIKRTAALTQLQEALSDVRFSAQSWSDLHSHKDVSRYDPSFSDQRTRDYAAAYDVDKKDKTKRQRKNALARYLTTYYTGDYPNVAESQYWTNY